LPAARDNLLLKIVSKLAHSRRSGACVSGREFGSPAQRNYAWNILRARSPVAFLMTPKEDPAQPDALSDEEGSDAFWSMNLVP